MKKILIAAVAVAGGVVAALKIKGGRSEQKLWSDATDSVPPSPPSQS